MIADVDGNGVPEIVVVGDIHDCGTEPPTPLYHTPLVLKRDRLRWTGGAFSWEESPSPGPGSASLSEDPGLVEAALPNPVAADLDDDGFSEILYPSYDGRLHAFWLDRTEHGSWPFDVPGSGIRFASEPVVADLDDDGQAEVLLTSWPEKASGAVGSLYVLDSTGQVLHAVPLPPSLSPAAWNGGNGALGAPTLADIDGDPDLELVVGTVNGGVVAIAEGDFGTKTATFAVRLSSVSASPVTAAWSTADGTATAGSDYASGAGTLRFDPGVLRLDVGVTLLGDVLGEPDEAFFLDLSSPSNATIASSRGRATIQDDDPTLLVAVGDASVVEGDGGTTGLAFAVSLSSPSAETVTVAYLSSDNTAVAPGDYLAAAGEITFPAGSTAPRTATVPVVGDTLDEPDERFSLVRLDPRNASLLDGEGIGTIADDDGGRLAGLELAHSSALAADLRAQAGPAADRDLYVLALEPWSSFEVVVEDASGDVGSGNGPGLERLGPDLVSTTTSSEAEGLGPVRSLRLRNATALTSDAFVSVRSGGCSLDCGTDDVYRIRARETTVSIPRFNNSGSQATVIVLQNTGPRPILGDVLFWSPAGTRLATQPLALAPRAVAVLPTASVPALAGQSGSVTVAHDGGYGLLAGKAVTLGPATGSSFDSPLCVRPR